MTTKIHIRTITPDAVQGLLETGYQLDLIDVRTPAEFREVHATGAVNVQLDEIDPEQMVSQRDPDAEPIYFICRSDSRAKKACEAFHSAGFTNVVNVAGGTIAWDDLGLPVIRGQKTIALERQVRIAAGSLVLLGILLGLLVHPWLLGLSAFVGSGLVFSGVTDTCGMAMLLARMPWNQVADTNPGCSLP